ncbi:endonuclease/reverse transcriptase [Blumeria hordei DH14]|uniref:Endonuclease/reverse transcriptase n=1 Tax=Blumeria graminis f. sp. hordei (strain DH14) TaxID=546991 RepID=N1J759_BLUG1|nr:endonuclease/reverse transcriptase [Blumeria hordei DH14]
MTKVTSCRQARHPDIPFIYSVTGNIAPGEDEIPTVILKIGWPFIETRVSSLERLIARRLSWIAIRHKIVASQHFVALPLRSAIDLTTCLVYDIEKALKSKLTASIVTLDMKCAFDGVLPGLLVHRLRDQGWPDNLVRWVASSLPNRVAKICLDSSTSPEFNVSCLKFSAEKYELQHCSCCQCDQQPRNTPMVQYIYYNSLRREFLKLKTTYIYILNYCLSRRFSLMFPEDLWLSRPFPNICFVSLPKLASLGYRNPSAQQPLHWLGVLFDKNLSFKWHTQTLASEALKVSHALLSLGNTTRGAPPHLLRHAVDACVLPIAYYASETWWPGRSRQGPKAQISNHVDSLLQQHSKVVLTSARATLPVYQTTPTAILHRESGLQQPEIALVSRVLIATVRLCCLDPRHPLLCRANRVLSLQHPISRFARRVLSLRKSEQINSISMPPWNSHECREATHSRVVGPKSSSADENRQVFLDFLQTIPFGDIIIYSDSLKQLNGLGGTGFIGYQGGVQVLHKSIALGKGVEVDAEVKGNLEGAKSALALPTAKFATDLWICLDNLEVATRLLSHFSGSSQAQFDEFLTSTPKWQERSRLAHTRRGQIQVRWVPSHTSIIGNEAVDKAAKDGCHLPTSDDLVFSYASLKRWANEFTMQATGKLWRTLLP